MQAMYPASVLLEAGLKAGESFSSLSFHIGWSLYTTLVSVRLAIAWTTDTKIPESKVFYPPKLVHDFENIHPIRLQQRSWLDFTCDKNQASCTWDGTSTLVVELSYNNVAKGTHVLLSYCLISEKYSNFSLII
jgi:hypothetical protein